MPIIRTTISHQRRVSRWISAIAVMVMTTLCGIGITPAAAQFDDFEPGSGGLEIPSRESDFFGGDESAEKSVVDIRVEGNETIPEAVILQKIQSQPNRPLTQRLVREDKRSLSATRWFFSVQERFEETPQGTVLIFTVVERPIVREVQFIGNKGVKKKYLEAWTGLKAGSPFDHYANREAVTRLEREYKEKGYFFIKVTLEKGGSPGEREVVFRIVEGPKVRVQHRTFEGNKFWGDGDLRKNLASKEALLGFFGGLYRPETLPMDVDALKQFYRAVGFFDVKVDVKPRFSPDKASVDLHFIIEEGVQYKVREIRFVGNEVIPTKRLQSESKLLAGQYYNFHPLSKDVKRMLSYYGEMGHFFASVNPVPHFTEQRGIVDLVFEIDEDRPRYVRNINVAYDGDFPHTKHTVILDRMLVAPGHLANPDLIRRSKSRISGSGLFEPGVIFEPVPVDPEQESFASTAAYMNQARGQDPGSSGGYDDWTERFAVMTRRSGYYTAIGVYPWLENSEGDKSSADVEQPATEQTSSHESSSQAPGRVELKGQPPQEQSEHRPQHLMEKLSYTSSVVSDGDSSGSNSGVGNSSEVSNSSEYVTQGIAYQQTPIAGGDSTSDATFLKPLFGHSGALVGDAKPAADSSLPVAQQFRAQELNGPGEQIARSELSSSEFTGFRTVTPVQFFDDLPIAYVTPSMEDPDAPVIRAQSPDRPFDPSAPRPSDPVLEGSPYRNQFQAIPPGWVDLNVRATEGRTGRLMFGAGINSDAGLVGSFVWDETNFDLFNPPTTFADIIEGRAWRGGGQRFRAEAAPGDIVSRYALSWTDPYFLYSDYSLTLSGFYFNRFYPDWKEDRLGGRIGVGRQLTTEWSVNAALRLEEVELSNPTVPTPAVLQDAIGQHFLSTIRGSATHDTRDMAIMPGEGHYFDVAYEQAFGDFSYPRVEAEGRQYFTLFNRPDGSGRQVLTLAGNIGWSGDDTPIFERYYAGGFQSFRGFSYRGVTPRQGGVAVGGTWQMLGSVEYRVPVTADDMINVVAFTDFGTVEEEISLDNFRATAGFGLRVVVPAMGPVPLAFDFAFPIMSQEFDDERIFSFYVGINR
ncbi:MAG: BamA/TamA family outer membrane protein [Planctomyces sp.]|nr:BamA/TamA family outer membrane protein [Planctomyces sp.]